MTKRIIRTGSIFLTSVMALTPATDAISAGRSGPAGGGGAAHVGGVGGGGGPHFSGGGGGGLHFGGGGGGPHFSGGGGPHFGGGAAHFSTAHFGGNFGQAHFSAPHVSALHSAPTHVSGTNFTAHARIESPIAHANTTRGALASRAVEGALHDRAALRNASTRAHIIASAATAGWHHGLRGGAGWWRHGNGGYGWVGPLFWPFAYYDIFDWVLWGYDDSFWDYGYGDLFAGLFGPYGYVDLSGYVGADSGPASATSAPRTQMAALTQMCGDETSDLAGFPIERLQQMVQLTDAEQAALNDLKDAMAKAAQGIKAACPSDIALTAPARLANMQQRIEAMIAAVTVVQPPLQKLYDLLAASDEQRARLEALNPRPTRAAPVVAAEPDCGVGRLEWPTAAIEQAVHPSAAQQASLAALASDTAKAAEMLKAACTAGTSLTPPARLAAIGARLDTMLQAVKTVRVGLDGFYAQLSDEQKARFEAIGPQLGEPARLEANQARSGTVHHRGYSILGRLEGLFRHLFRF